MIKQHFKPQNTLKSAPPNAEELSHLYNPVAHHPWIEPLVRSGFAAKGIVYLVTGTLAAEAAIGIGGATTDSSGALIAIVTQPFGEILLSILVVGLIGYTLWRFIQAILDPEHLNSKGKFRTLSRLGCAISGFSYMGLAFTAIQILLGWGSSDRNSPELWAERFLIQPYGEWLITGVGLLVIGLGSVFLYRAYATSYTRMLRSQNFNSAVEKWIDQIAKFGVAARGVIFVIIGSLLLKAAFLSDAHQAKGQGGALATLMQSPLGSWLLGAIAFGFIAHAAYSFISAKYHRLSITAD